MSHLETTGNQKGFQDPNLGFLDDGREGNHDNEHKGNKQWTDIPDMTDQVMKVSY